jgi:hypothetical protein
MNILAPLALFSFGITGAVVLPTISGSPDDEKRAGLGKVLQWEAGGQQAPSQDPSAPLSIILLTTREVDAALPKGQVRVPAGTSVRLDLDRGSEVDVRFAGTVMTVPRDALLNNGPVLRPREVAAAPVKTFPADEGRVNTSFEPSLYDRYPIEDRGPMSSAYDRRRSVRAPSQSPTVVFIDNSSTGYNGGHRSGGGCGSSCTPTIRYIRSVSAANRPALRPIRANGQRSRLNRGG